MYTLNKNLIANFLGKSWTALLSIIFLPIYVKLLGIESFGIVGLYTTLLALFNLLDFGLSTTLNREISRMTSLSTPAEEYRDLTRTLEYVYWGIALALGIIIFSLSPFLSDYWLTTKHLSSDCVRRATNFMAITIFFQWPFSLYSGGLMGLNKQVQLNIIIIICSTFRWLGMILILTFVSATIDTFFIWQTLINALQTLSAALIFWKNLPKASTLPRFDKNLLTQIGKFSIGMTGIMILSAILTQTDKIIISKMLPLEDFGYYNFATSISSSLFIVISIVQATYFPLFSRIIASKNSQELTKVYHTGCQLITILTVPITILFFFFSSEIIYLWTGDQLITGKTSVIAGLLMLGSLLNGLMTLPYTLQIAHGWTKLSLYQNVIAIVILIPLLVLAIYFFNTIGAACIWIILNAGYLLITIPFMHKKIIPAEKKKWYLQDIIIPLAGAAAIGFISHFCFSKIALNKWQQIGLLFGVYICLLSAAILLSSIIRKSISKFLQDKFSLIKTKALAYFKY